MPQPALKKTQGGFTLIELLVTTAITAMILLTASSILMTFFVSNTRTTLRRQIKSEGNRALSRVEFIARGAQRCADVSDQTITFTYVDGESYVFDKTDDDNLTMQRLDNAGSPVGAQESLLTNFVIARDGDFRLQCVTEPNSTKQYANIRFDVTTANAETATVVESFTTLVSLRNSR